MEKRISSRNSNSNRAIKRRDGTVHLHLHPVLRLVVLVLLLLVPVVMVDGRFVAGRGGGNKSSIRRRKLDDLPEANDKNQIGNNDNDKNNENENDIENENNNNNNNQDNEDSENNQNNDKNNENNNDNNNENDKNNNDKNQETFAPSQTPSLFPSDQPSSTPPPTSPPTHQPTNQPTIPPTTQPTNPPTIPPTIPPTAQPTNPPTVRPTSSPTVQPEVDDDETQSEIQQPTFDPTTSQPITPPSAAAPVESSLPVTTITEGDDDEEEVFGVKLPTIDVDLVLSVEESTSPIVDDMDTYFIAFVEDVVRSSSEQYNFQYSHIETNTVVSTLDNDRKRKKRKLQVAGYSIRLDGDVFFRGDVPTEESLAQSLSVYFSFWGATDLQEHFQEIGLASATVSSITVDGEIVSQGDIFGGTGTDLDSNGQAGGQASDQSETVSPTDDSDQPFLGSEDGINWAMVIAGLAPSFIAPFMIFFGVRHYKRRRAKKEKEKEEKEKQKQQEEKQKSSGGSKLQSMNRMSRSKNDGSLNGTDDEEANLSNADDTDEDIIKSENSNRTDSASDNSNELSGGETLSK